MKPLTDPIDRTMAVAPGNPYHMGGTVPSLIRIAKSEVWVPQRAHPRRNRKSAAMRLMACENIVTKTNCIYPLFLHDEDYNVAIASMS